MVLGKRIYYRLTRRFYLPNKDALRDQVQALYDQMRDQRDPADFAPIIVLPQKIHDVLISLINAGRIHRQTSYTDNTDDIFRYALEALDSNIGNAFIVRGLTDLVSGYHEGKSSEEEAIYGLQYYLESVRRAFARQKSTDD